MKLNELLSNIDVVSLAGDTTQEITGLATDSRSAEAGNLFICHEGVKFDSHSDACIADLMAKGVTAFVVQKDITTTGDACVIYVDNTEIATADFYAAWYHHPADKLTVIGITGSKGKTTAAHMMTACLRKAGHKTGLIGTNGFDLGNDDVRELANTTPAADDIQKYLAELVEKGFDSVVLEVSSQGMKMHRVDCITFDAAIWLNLQRGDHIGGFEHPTFEDYMFCKAQLLNHAKLGYVHGDDEYAKDFTALVHTPYLTFGADAAFDYTATDIRDDFDEVKEEPGIVFHVTHKDEDLGDFRVNMPGAFNAWNALPVIAVSHHLGLPMDAVKDALNHTRIRGRDDIVYRGKFRVCVDFAHNGESTAAHLQALRQYRPKRIVCIFGADGNRTKDRRYGMGEAAGKYADFSIVTSGHNRDEEFKDIAADTEVGLARAGDPDYIVMEDRKKAIRYAMEHAQDGDMITILGLGHEHWQEIKGIKYEYSDIDYVRSLVEKMGLDEEETPE